MRAKCLIRGKWRHEGAMLIDSRFLWWYRNGVPAQALRSVTNTWSILKISWMSMQLLTFIGKWKDSVISLLSQHMCKESMTIRVKFSLSRKRRSPEPTSRATKEFQRAHFSIMNQVTLVQDSSPSTMKKRLAQTFCICTRIFSTAMTSTFQQLSWRMTCQSSLN